MYYLISIVVAFVATMFLLRLYQTQNDGTWCDCIFVSAIIFTVTFCFLLMPHLTDLPRGHVKTEEVHDVVKFEQDYRYGKLNVFCKGVASPCYEYDKRICKQNLVDQLPTDTFNPCTYVINTRKGRIISIYRK